jgi:RNA polymerase sigma-70 factor (ECF subfamily)
MQPTEPLDLIRRNAGLIHKIARAYCRDATDREDVVQEIAVQLWRCHDRYDPAFRESTWIYRIALNVAISFHRRERRHQQRRTHIECDLLAATAATEPSAQVAQLLASIDDLATLDKALVLLWLDSNEHAVIADILGISVSNVGTKLMRIKDRLRAAMSARARAEDTK